MARAAKTAKTRSKNGAKALDAIELLKNDHRTVEGLFEQYEKASGNAKKADIAKKICMELAIHTTIEEEVFYPACRDEIEDDLLDEAYVEHDGAKMLVAEIMESAPDEPFYDAKVKVLSEMIKHHVKEEEQRDGMFAQAKATDLDLEELGGRMMARKEELKAEFEETGIPTPTTRAAKGVQLEHGHPLESAQ